ncbi:MAG: hypothetical protein A3H02_02710 [Candidatus Niyogibacteria bacterium RIFCSPLOWO2_12_FULL_41_13]|uniref:Uncharacterized protein n=1 Tax=Candidatus Niyogibacteria bacterium RIFCSPLOWO2_12_FULL_41_13 TaxID=1801726 RepID=A0A1G2F398_9BACT|nr:MAG: hypothetical protein A3H02_02710 [Candidatus Niyogibacteria bacterium RIFCSPLOWO2_12_FULL_41_13]
MKYGKLTLGQVEAIVNKLGGMEGVKRFLSGETVIQVAEHKFKTWKTIKLGTGLKATDDFRKVLNDNGFDISDWASDILGKPAFTVAAEKTEVDLVKVTVAELGFKKGARRDQIYKRTKELGLVLCPPEVGPQLRLQYQDQPNGEWILVGMKPITGSCGYLLVFRVERGDSGLWLNSYWSSFAYVWSPDDWWVFCLPRK